MDIQAFDRLTFRTRDADACLGYYNGLLGMEAVSQGGVHTLSFPGGAFTVYADGGPSPAPVGFDAVGSQNYCLRVQGEPEAILDRLLRAGADVVEPAVRARAGAHGPIRSIYTFDPDHNLVELGVYAPAPVPFAVTGLDHLVLVTGDLETAMAFYQGVLGLEGETADGHGLLRLGDQKCNVHHRVPKYAPHIPYAAVGSLSLRLTVRGTPDSVAAALERAHALVSRPRPDVLLLRDPDGNLIRLRFIP